MENQHHEHPDASPPSLLARPLGVCSRYARLLQLVLPPGIVGASDRCSGAAVLGSCMVAEGPAMLWAEAVTYCQTAGGVLAAPHTPAALDAVWAAFPLTVVVNLRQGPGANVSTAGWFWTLPDGSTLNGSSTGRGTWAECEPILERRRRRGRGCGSGASPTTTAPSPRTGRRTAPMRPVASTTTSAQPSGPCPSAPTPCVWPRSCVHSGLSSKGEQFKLSLLKLQ